MARPGASQPQREARRPAWAETRRRSTCRCSAGGGGQQHPVDAAALRAGRQPAVGPVGQQRLWRAADGQPNAARRHIPTRAGANSCCVLDTLQFCPDQLVRSATVGSNPIAIQVCCVAVLQLLCKHKRLSIAMQGVTNFAVFSSGATAVSLVLFTEADLQVQTRHNTSSMLLSSSCLHLLSFKTLAALGFSRMTTPLRAPAQSQEHPSGDTCKYHYYDAGSTPHT